MNVPDPASFVVMAQQRLGDGEADQLAVGQLGTTSATSPELHAINHLDDQTAGAPAESLDGSSCCRCGLAAEGL